MTIPDLSWRDDAECKNHPKWLFFSDAYIDLAKKVCARCPVINECLDHALANREEGVWGGTSDRDRKPGRRSRVEPRQAECVCCGELFTPRFHTSRYCPAARCQRARNNERNRRYTARRQEAS